jgi:DNA-binding transcriptional ArsR family regulator
MKSLMTADDDELAVFRAIADPTRRRLLEALRGGPLSVNRMAASFPVSRPAISKHLRCLREAGLVSEERQGRRRIYRLQALALLEVRAWVDGFAPSADSAAVAGSTRRRARGRAAAGSSAKPGGWRVW